VDVGQVPGAQPEGGERVAALVGEGGHSGPVARVTEGRDRRVHVVEAQRAAPVCLLADGCRRPGRRAAHPEVSEEAIPLKREPQRGPVAGREFKYRLASRWPQPARQAGVVLP
jgi:hypothetical protein